MISQQDPFLQLTAPSNNSFHLTEFSGTEALSQLFHYTLTTYSDNHNITPEQMLTKSIGVKINCNETSCYFNGIIGGFKADKIVKNLRRYSIEMMPALWQLGFVSDCRIFQNKKVPDIVQSLCNQFDIKMDISALRKQYVPHDYRVQYRETTLNFIQRLLEEEGIFYFFRHSKDQHTLVLADLNEVFKFGIINPLIYREEESYQNFSIHHWIRQHQVYSGQFIHADFNFQTPDTSFLAKSMSNPQLAAANHFKLFDYPGRYDDPTHGQTLAQLRLQALEANYHFVEAASNYIGMTIGSKFTFNEHPSAVEAGDYFPIKVNHSAYDSTQLSLAHFNSEVSQSYANAFTCLPLSAEFSPMCQSSKPIVTGYQTAIVVGDGQAGQEVNVDPFGRIQVRFHWDREQQSSCRIRVAQNWAGQNWGMVFHPRIGQEVVVQFENGDPDRPLVVGSVYNAEQMPPYELTDHPTQSGIKTRSSQRGASDEANELRFEDKKGFEEIYLHAQKDLICEIKNNETKTIKKGDQMIKVSAGKSVLEAAQAIELKVGNNQMIINIQGVFINGQQIQ